MSGAGTGTRGEGAGYWQVGGPMQEKVAVTTAVIELSSFRMQSVCAVSTLQRPLGQRALAAASAASVARPQAAGQLKDEAAPEAVRRWLSHVHGAPQ